MDAKEKLGEAIDSLDNLSFGVNNMTQISAEIHVEGLKKSLPRVVKEMKEAFVELTGENPWEE